MNTLDRKLGFLSSLPLTVVLLGVVSGANGSGGTFLDHARQGVFAWRICRIFLPIPTFFSQGYYKSLLWSLGMALGLDRSILLVISWPLAYGMSKVFGRFTLVLTIAVVMSLFVSENIRLFGWVLTLMKGGLIEGHFRALHRRRVRKSALWRRDHRIRAGLCVPALYAVSAGAGHRHGARRYAAGGL